MSTFFWVVSTFNLPLHYGYLKGIGLHFFSIDPWHIAKQASYGYLKGIGLHFFSIDPLPHFKSKLPLTFTI